MSLLVDRRKATNRCIVTAAMLLIWTSACGTDSGPSPADQSSSEKPPRINPARIDRARTFLPDGYEVSDLVNRISPITSWGYGERWTTDPARCAALADPTADATINETVVAPRSRTGSARGAAPETPALVVTRQMPSWVRT